MGKVTLKLLRGEAASHPGANARARRDAINLSMGAPRRPQAPAHPKRMGYSVKGAFTAGCMIRPHASSTRLIGRVILFSFLLALSVPSPPALPQAALMLVWYSPTLSCRDIPSFATPISYFMAVVSMSMYVPLSCLFETQADPNAFG
jgi:hypothetical protein